VYRVWPEKNSFADTFGLFCLFAVFDPDPNQMKGVYMFDLQQCIHTLTVVERGRGCRTIGKEERKLEF